MAGTTETVVFHMGLRVGVWGGAIDVRFRNRIVFCLVLLLRSSKWAVSKA